MSDLAILFLAMYAGCAFIGSLLGTVIALALYSMFKRRER